MIGSRCRSAAGAALDGAAGSPREAARRRGGEGDSEGRGGAEER